LKKSHALFKRNATVPQQSVPQAVFEAAHGRVAAFGCLGRFFSEPPLAAHCV